MEGVGSVGGTPSKPGKLGSSEMIGAATAVAPGKVGEKAGLARPCLMPFNSASAALVSSCPTKSM